MRVQYILALIHVLKSSNMPNFCITMLLLCTVRFIKNLTEIQFTNELNLGKV